MEKNQNPELPTVTVKDLEAVGINYTISPGDILELVAEQKIEQIKKELEPLNAEFEELKKEYQILVLDQQNSIVEELKALVGDEKNVQFIYVSAPSFKKNPTPFEGPMVEEMRGDMMIPTFLGIRHINDLRRMFRYNNSDIVNIGPLLISADREDYYFTGGKNEEQVSMHHCKNEDMVVLCVGIKQENLESSKTTESGFTVQTGGVKSITYHKHFTVKKEALKALMVKAKDFQKKREDFKNKYSNNGGNINVRALINKAKNSINKKILQSQSPELVEKLKTFFGLDDL